MLVQPMALNLVKYLFVSLLLFVFSGRSALSEDAPPKHKTTGVSKTAPLKTKKKKPKPAGQIEGTKALDKGEIEAEPIIRSHYDKNGEKLEVDPD